MNTTKIETVNHVLDYSKRTRDNEKNIAILSAIYNDFLIVDRFELIGNEIYVHLFTYDNPIKICNISNTLYLALVCNKSYKIKSWQIIKDEDNKTYIIKFVFNIKQLN